MGVRRALLVGVNVYSDGGFAPLRFPKADAEALAAALRDPRYGGFASVELMVEGDLSSRGIVARLKAFSDTLAPEDLAFVYFSGHGTRWIDERNRSQVFLAGSDTRRDDPLGSGIPMQAMQDYLAALPTARRVLVVDACFTGDGKVDSDDTERAARARIDEKPPFSERFSEKEAQLFATTYGRPALEQNSVGHGVYTYHFVRALTETFDEADLNGDLVVSVSEAHDWARDRTMEATASVQVPMAYYKVVGREDLVLSGDPRSRKRVEMAMVSAYEGTQQGLRLFVDGREKGAFPRTALVDPGPHTVEFRNLSDKVVDRGRFTFGREKVYSVAKIRDWLNGGRHLLAAGYAHAWLPGEAVASQKVPSAPGLRLGYGLRLPSRVPFLRRLGLQVDVALGLFGEKETTLVASPTAPATTLLEIGAGPILRLDLPYALLSVQPRFAVVNLFRQGGASQPFTNWTFGAVGGSFVAGFRPHYRISVQAYYQPMVFNAALGGGTGPRVELMHRVGGGVELGF